MGAGIFQKNGIRGSAEEGLVGREGSLWKEAAYWSLRVKGFLNIYSYVSARVCCLTFLCGVFLSITNLIKLISVFSCPRSQTSRVSSLPAFLSSPFELILFRFDP